MAQMLDCFCPYRKNGMPIALPTIYLSIKAGKVLTICVFYCRFVDFCLYVCLFVWLFRAGF